MQTATNSWYRITNESPQAAELLIYGTVGDANSAAEPLVRQLQAMAGRALTVRINSPGGSVFDGLAVYNALMARTAPTTVVVEGLGASIASVIAMAGRPIRMYESAFLMIHDPSGMVYGRTEDLAAMSLALAKIRDSLATIYASRTGKTAAEALELMKAETWLTASEAKTHGFADEIISDGKPQATARFALPYAKVPAQVLNRFGTGTPTPTPDAAELQARGEWLAMDAEQRGRWLSEDVYRRTREMELTGKLRVHRGQGGRSYSAAEARAMAAAMRK